MLETDFFCLQNLQAINFPAFELFCFGGDFLGRRPSGRLDDLGCTPLGPGNGEGVRGA